MEVLEFDMVVVHEGKRINARCQKFQAIKVPQVRVECNGIFTFYEVNEKGKRFFRFKSNFADTESLISSIEIALSKSRKAKTKLAVQA